jgi:hypothetical protein
MRIAQLCNLRLHRHAIAVEKAANSTGLAKEPALDSHRLKTTGESVDSLFSEH